ncbi:MAG: hypothetical protein WCR21_04925 [Bacteroidota bacterium]
MATKVLFEEKQYLGHNRFSIVIRTLFTFFCFMAYYLSQNPELGGLNFVRYSVGSIGELNSGLIFFFIGIAILILSAVLTFILHIQTTVYEGYIIIDGFWTSRKVKIDLHSIRVVRRSRYKKNNLKPSAYNLHNNGIIRFYTSGEDFVELVDETGFIYRVGSQKSLDLFHALNDQLLAKGLYDGKDELHSSF